MCPFVVGRVRVPAASSMPGHCVAELSLIPMLSQHCIACGGGRICLIRAVGQAAGTGSADRGRLWDEGRVWWVPEGEGTQVGEVS